MSFLLKFIFSSHFCFCFLLKNTYSGFLPTEVNFYPIPNTQIKESGFPHHSEGTDQRDYMACSKYQAHASASPTVLTFSFILSNLPRILCQLWSESHQCDSPDSGLSPPKSIVSVAALSILTKCELDTVHLIPSLSLSLRGTRSSNQI